MHKKTTKITFRSSIGLSFLIAFQKRNERWF